MKGEIIYRNNNAFVLNTSKYKAYQFTITIKKNNVVLSTEKLTLAPGEQRYLGILEDKKVIPRNKTTVFRFNFSYYRIPNEELDEFRKKMPDMVQVEDTLTDEYGDIKPELLIIKSSIEYSVTGQLEIPASEYNEKRVE